MSTIQIYLRQTRLLSLYSDIVFLVAAGTLLIAVALIASYLPATLNPMVALRNE